MDLDFYVRVRTCKKRVTGKQPLVSLICYILIIDIMRNQPYFHPIIRMSLFTRMLNSKCGTYTPFLGLPRNLALNCFHHCFCTFINLSRGNFIVFAVVFQNVSKAYHNELVLDYVTCAELFLKSRMFYRFDALVIRAEKILHMLN